MHECTSSSRQMEVNGERGGHTAYANLTGANVTGRYDSCGVRRRSTGRPRAGSPTTSASRRRRRAARLNLVAAFRGAESSQMCR